MGNFGYDGLQRALQLVYESTMGKPRYAVGNWSAYINKLVKRSFREQQKDQEDLSAVAKEAQSRAERDMAENRPLLSTTPMIWQAMPPGWFVGPILVPPPPPAAQIYMADLINPVNMQSVKEIAPGCPSVASTTSELEASSSEQDHITHHIWIDWQSSSTSSLSSQAECPSKEGAVWDQGLATSFCEDPTCNHIRFQSSEMDCDYKCISAVRQWLKIGGDSSGDVSQNSEECDFADDIFVEDVSQSGQESDGFIVLAHANLDDSITAESDEDEFVLV